MSSYESGSGDTPASVDLQTLRHMIRPEHIEHVEVGTLTPYKRALRKRKKTYLDAMRASVAAFGIVLPLLADTQNVLIAGEGVFAAAKSLGYTHVPVLRVEHLDDTKVAMLRVALNKMSDHSEWDLIELKAEFTDLLSLDIDLQLDVTGFLNVEIDTIVYGAGEEVPDPDDEPIALGDPAISRLGDHWDLGAHSVYCGSSLEPSVLARLMDGARARMVLTDHPYNVRIDGHVSGLGKTRHREFAHASGEMSEAQFITFLTTSIDTLAACCCDGALLFMYMDWRHQWEMLSAIRAVGLTMINMAVWDKQTGGMGSFYRSQHELVFIARKGKVQHRNNVQLGRFGRTRTNVWRYPGVNSFGAERDEMLAMHPTCKSVTMLADAIRDATDRGEIVLDGFLGSGSTLIAAERTGRLCRGVEIDPLYVDAIIHRWARATGAGATLRETGETFTQVAQRRAAGAQDPRPEIAPRMRVRSAA